MPPGPTGHTTYDHAGRSARLGSGGATTRRLLRFDRETCVCFGLECCCKVCGRVARTGSAQRRTHIIDGDASGDGYLWPGAPAKTQFLQSWSGTAARTRSPISLLRSESPLLEKRCSSPGISGPTSLQSRDAIRPACSLTALIGLLLGWPVHARAKSPVDAGHVLASAYDAHVTPSAMSATPAERGLPVLSRRRTLYAPDGLPRLGALARGDTHPPSVCNYDGTAQPVQTASRSGAVQEHTKGSVSSSLTGCALPQRQQRLALTTFSTA